MDSGRLCSVTIACVAWWRYKKQLPDQMDSLREPQVATSVRGPMTLGDIPKTAFHGMLHLKRDNADEDQLGALLLLCQPSITFLFPSEGT